MRRLEQLRLGSRWVHVGVIVRGPPSRFITWTPADKALRDQLDGGYVAGDVSGAYLEIQPRREAVTAAESIL